MPFLVVAWCCLIVPDSFSQTFYKITVDKLVVKDDGDCSTAKDAIVFFDYEISNPEIFPWQVDVKYCCTVRNDGNANIYDIVMLSDGTQDVTNKFTGFDNLDGELVANDLAPGHQANGVNGPMTLEFSEACEIVHTLDGTAFIGPSGGGTIKGSDTASVVIAWMVKCPGDIEDKITCRKPGSNDPEHPYPPNDLRGFPEVLLNCCASSDIIETFWGMTEKSDCYEVWTAEWDVDINGCEPPIEVLVHPVAHCIQNFTIYVDEVAPELTCDPIQLSCNEPIPPCDESTVHVVENCELESLECTGDVHPIINGCIETTIRHWKAKDKCGNEGTCNQFITRMLDNEGPKLIDCPLGIDLGCNPVLPPPPVPPTYMDNCDGIIPIAPVPENYTDVIEGDPCHKKLTRTWIIPVDSCGNPGDQPCVQIYTWIEDIEPPVIDCKDKDLGCNPAPYDPEQNKPAVSDNCTPPELIVLTWTDCGIEQVGCLRKWTICWEAYDECLNRGECKEGKEVISWKEDTEGPQLTNCPQGEDFGCNPVFPIPPVPPTFEDTCDGIIPPDGFVDEDVQVGCNWTKTRTWNPVYDACGNPSVGVCVQVYTWTDSLCCGGCTLTYGYWKTHSKYGPAPYDDTWAIIGEDTTFYLSGKSWYQVLQVPVAGNAYYQLVYQFIGAKLNLLNGAASIPEVDDALAWADKFFTAHAPSETLSRALRADVVKYAGILGSFNEGTIGPGHCSD